MGIYQKQCSLASNTSARPGLLTAEETRITPLFRQFNTMLLKQNLRTEYRIFLDGQVVNLI